MSILASQTPAMIPIPFDAGQTVTIRKINGRQLLTAQQEHLAALIAGRPVRGWATIFNRAIRDGAAVKDLTPDDPLNGYDPYTLIKAGVTAWSYPEPVTPEIIDQLDDDQVGFFASAVLRQTKPGLFQSTAEQETDQKNA